MPQNENNELLRLENVAVSYSRRLGPLKRSEHWALENISFSVFKGETIGIVGRNGVGKTTLLRLLSTIIEPDRGVIWRKAGLSTALLSIQAGFLGALTGIQNAVIGGMTLGISKRDVEKNIDRITEFSELGGFINKPVATYSSGMRARLGFAVAMIAAPDLLLIDEVISVGDEAFRKKSSAVIKQRADTLETTILVTHNMALARSLCTRLVWIENGVVRSTGAPDEILKQYLPA